MTILSTRCQYALYALLELQGNSTRAPISASEIARQRSIPLRFLEVILRELKDGGFVSSVRGKDGGYLLQCEGAKTTVADLLAFYTSRDLNSFNQVSDYQEWKASDIALIDFLEHQAQKSIFSELGNYTLAELCEEEKTEKNIPEYVI